MTLILSTPFTAAAFETAGTSKESEKNCVIGLIKEELRSTPYAKLDITDVTAPRVSSTYEYKATDSRLSYDGAIRAEVKREETKTTCTTLRETSYFGNRCNLSGCAYFTFSLNVNTQLIYKEGASTIRFVR